MNASSKHGQAVVGTSPAQLNSTARRLLRGVVVKALSTNSASIFVGTSSSVTTGNGYELTAGQSVLMPVTDISSIWAVSGSAAQAACWIDA